MGILDRLDLESWVNLAKLISKKEIADEYECA